MESFEEYMKAKISTSLLFEREMHEAILTLYHKGLIDVDMNEGDPLISISNLGKSAYASFLLHYMPPAGEA